MNTDVETIAAHMRLKPQAVKGYLADSIEVRHVPPTPVDGQIEGTRFAKMAEAFSTSDDIDREILSIDVEGDEIVQRAIIRNHADHTITAHTGRFRVEGGQIVAVRSIYEPREAAEPS